MATDYTLLQTQKNEVFEGIIAHKLEPSEFQWEEIELQGEESSYGPDPGIVSCLTHIPTSYDCLFDMRENFYSVTFAPGRNLPRERISVERWDGIGGFQGFAFIWLSCLQKQYKARDLWAEYVGGKQLASVIDSSSQDTFSDSEQEVIKEGLEQIRNYLFEQVKDSEHQQEQQQYIRKQLDFLIDAAKRQPRKDWGFCLLGNLMTLAFGMALTSKQAEELIRIAGSCIYGLFSGGPILIQ